MVKSKVALHGGGAAKVSGFYESHWTAFTLIDILIGRAISITLEPPGTAGYGFEFSIERPAGREVIKSNTRMQRQENGPSRLLRAKVSWSTSEPS